MRLKSEREGADRRLCSRSRLALFLSPPPLYTPSNSLAADHLVLVVLARQDLEGGLDDAAAEAQDQVQRRLLLDVVVRQRAAVLQLLAREDEALLVGGDA